jgi:hypothetical protein
VKSLLGFENYVEPRNSSKQEPNASYRHTVKTVTMR